MRGNDTPLRLMFYDRTCAGQWPLRPGLSDIWETGAWIYRALGRIDRVRGVASWDEALDWLASVASGRRVAEVQYWGHGKWGTLLIDRVGLDRTALLPGHPFEPRLRALRDRLAEDALFWFRTCETFGAQPGHDFATAWTDFFGCDAAGHTYVIHYYQSGLHRLRAGTAPTWSAQEGIKKGTPDTPEQAFSSSPFAPNTVTCLQGAIPGEFS